MHRRGLKQIIQNTSLDKGKVNLPLLRGSYLNDAGAHTSDSFSIWIEGEDLYDHVTTFTSLLVFTPGASTEYWLTCPGNFQRGLRIPSQHICPKTYSFSLPGHIQPTHSHRS